MNWVDLVLLIIIGSSVISGFSAGFARVGIGTAATLIGMLAGFWFYGEAGGYVLDYVSSRPVANLIGFFLVFGAVIVLGAIVSRILASLFRWIGLSWADRLLGAAFGVVRGALIAAALVTVLLAFAPSPPPPSITESKVMPYVVDASDLLAYVTPREIKDAFRGARDKVKRIWDERLNQKPVRLPRQEV